eukprot:m.836052 g.836052  ORF g.836052 m.836052 type:complete len:148 (-) comp23456_c0_seq4:3241-3684(-)
MAPSTMHKDSPVRTLAKTTSFRVFATTATMLLAFALTGSLTTAIKIGIPDTLVKLLFYYMHERLWQTAGFAELKGRTFYKMATWKVCAISSTITITAIVNGGDLRFAFKLGPIDTVIKSLIFYLHEQIWEKISWGIERKGDSNKKEK